MKRRWAVIIHAKQMKEIPASAGKCADHIWSPVEILSCSLLQENWAMLRLAGANTRFNSSYTLSPSSLSLCVCVCVCVCLLSLLSPPFSLLTPPPSPLSLSLSTYPAASPYFPSLGHFSPLSHFIPHTIKANNNNKHLFHLCECLCLCFFFFFPAPRQCVPDTSYSTPHQPAFH